MDASGSQDHVQIPENATLKFCHETINDSGVRRSRRHVAPGAEGNRTKIGTSRRAPELDVDCDALTGTLTWFVISFLSQGSTESKARAYNSEELTYWRLYGSLAAYRMAIQKEKEEHEEDTSNNFSYDWIVSTRFDIAWMRPLPSLRKFSPETVWFGSSTW